MSQTDFYRFTLVAREARKRAGRRAGEYSLTAEDLIALWNRCEGRCELTRIPFDFTPMAGKFQRRPYAPSVDRRDSSLGYTIENVRVVCVAVNLAMNQWGESVLLRIAAAMFEAGTFARMGRKDHAPYVLPEGVRLYMGKKSIRYLARVKDFGTEKHLGTYDTVDQALEARLAWARANSSLKVIRQVFAHTRNPELLNEINSLQGSQLVGGEGFEPMSPDTRSIPYRPLS